MDSDGNGYYDSDLDCQWLISGPDFRSLEISFQSFNLEGAVARTGKNLSSDADPNCPHDYLELRDGPGPYAQLLGKFCGASSPSTVSSSTNFMWIRFVSDGSYNFPGFRTTITSRECEFY